MQGIAVSGQWRLAHGAPAQGLVEQMHVLVDFTEHGLLDGGEMTTEGPPGDPGALRDVLDRHRTQPTLVEQVECGTGHGRATA